MVKRFAVTSITRDKAYPISAGNVGSKISYLSVNRNGEAEVVKVVLRQKPKIKNLKFDFDFAEINIKGRGAKGNILTKNLVHKIELKEEGISTLSARKIWWDDTVSRLNADERGRLVGEFKPDDKIVAIMSDGTYRMYPQSLNTHFEENMIILDKFDPEHVYSMVHYDGEKGHHYVKRFVLESSEKAQSLLTDHEESKLDLISKHTFPVVKVEFDKRSSNKAPEIVELHDFISVKGYKALGNRISADKVKQVTELDPLPEPEKPESAEQNLEQQEVAEVTTESTVEVAKEEKVKPAIEPEKPEVEGVKELPKKEEPKPIKEKAAPIAKKEKSEPAAPAKKKELPVAEPKAEKKKPVPKKEQPSPKKKDDDDDEVPPEGPVQITLEL